MRSSSATVRFSWGLMVILPAAGFLLDFGAGLSDETPKSFYFWWVVRARCQSHLSSESKINNIYIFCKLKSNFIFMKSVRY